MGLYAKPPKVPDYSNEQAAQLGLSRDMLAEMQAQTKAASIENEANRAVAQPIIDLTLKAAKDNNEFSAAQLERYNKIYAPGEDKLAADAATFDTAARRESEASRAISDVGQAMDAGLRNANQTLAGYGVQPGVGRSVALNQQAALDRAKAQAQAGTDAERNVEDKGFARRVAVAEMGRGIPTMANAASNTALTNAQVASNTGLNTASGRVQGSQGALNWGQAGGNVLTQAVDTKNTRFKNELDKYTQDQTTGPAGFAKEMLKTGLGIAYAKG